jgi:hypothetical protein
MSFVSISGVPLAKARRKVRELIAAIDQHTQSLKDCAEDSGFCPGPNDPRNFIDIRVAFPVYSHWGS